MHVEERPDPPRNREPDLSKRSERIILRLLAKHPDDRYPSATALLEDLADASAHRPTADIPVPDGYLRNSNSVQSEEEEKRTNGWWKVW